MYKRQEEELSYERSPIAGRFREENIEVKDFMKNEMCIRDSNRNDAGAVSLGTLQWRANRARDYLRNLYNVDPKLFRTTMGNRCV